VLDSRGEKVKFYLTTVLAWGESNFLKRCVTNGKGRGDQRKNYSGTKRAVKRREKATTFPRGIA